MDWRDFEREVLASFEEAQRGESDQKKSEEIVNLLAEVQKERDGRNEERFYFIVVVLVIFDGHLFMHMDNLTGPVVILFLELVVLIPIAKKCGVGTVVEVLDKILNVIPKVK